MLCPELTLIQDKLGEGPAQGRVAGRRIPLPPPELLLQVLWQPPQQLRVAGLVLGYVLHLCSNQDGSECCCGSFIEKTCIGSCTVKSLMQLK